MEAELTLVRSAETKEPVLATEYTGDLLELGRRIDEITDPNGCEYKDVSVEFEFNVGWSDSASDYKKLCSDEKVEFMDSGNIPPGLCFTLIGEFDSDEDWTEYPEGLNCMVVGPSIDERYSGSELSIEDVF